jgi:hypothetical protein
MEAREKARRFLLSQGLNEDYRQPSGPTLFNGEGARAWLYDDGSFAFSTGDARAPGIMRYTSAQAAELWRKYCTSRAKHVRDEDCKITVPEGFYKECPDCHVLHGGACPGCGGHGFHRFWCPHNDETADIGESAPDCDGPDERDGDEAQAVHCSSCGQTWPRSFTPGPVGWCIRCGADFPYLSLVW